MTQQDLALPILPGEAFGQMVAYYQGLVEVYARLAAAYSQVGYPSGPSESGKVTGGDGDGPGHGDPVPGTLADSGTIRDSEVRMWRATLRREDKWQDRHLPARINRLYRELGWEPPTLQAEIDGGYREPDGRLRVVGG